MASPFRTLKKPRPHQLAINTAYRNTSEYDEFFRPHAEYWSHRADEAFDVGDTATHRVAHQLLGPMLTILAQDISHLRSEMRLLPQFTPEAQSEIMRDRRCTLHILAASVLCKHLMSPDAVVRDGRYADVQELMAPEVGFWAGQEPLDSRVQITASLADRLVKPYGGSKPAVWYRYQSPDDGLELFVRRTLTAEPVVSSSAEQEVLTFTRGAEIDYTSMQTLFPYLVSKA